MVLFLPFYGEPRQFCINFKKLEMIKILIKGGGVNLEGDLTFQKRAKQISWPQEFHFSIMLE